MKGDAFPGVAHNCLRLAIVGFPGLLAPRHAHGQTGDGAAVGTVRPGRIAEYRLNRGETGRTASNFHNCQQKAIMGHPRQAVILDKWAPLCFALGPLLRYCLANSNFKEVRCPSEFDSLSS